MICDNCDLTYPECGVFPDGCRERQGREAKMLALQENSGLTKEQAKKAIESLRGDKS